MSHPTHCSNRINSMRSKLLFCNKPNDIYIQSIQSNWMVKLIWNRLSGHIWLFGCMRRSTNLICCVFWPFTLLFFWQTSFSTVSDLLQQTVKLRKHWDTKITLNWAKNIRQSEETLVSATTLNENIYLTYINKAYPFVENIYDCVKF